MDPYKVLNLSRDATKEDIRKAYKKMAFKYHPDRNLNNSEEASEKFKEIHEAYVKIENGEYNSENDYKFNMNIKAIIINFWCYFNARDKNILKNILMRLNLLDMNQSL